MNQEFEGSLEGSNEVRRLVLLNYVMHSIYACHEWALLGGKWTFKKWVAVVSDTPKITPHDLERAFLPFPFFS